MRNAREYDRGNQLLGLSSSLPKVWTSRENVNGGKKAGRGNWGREGTKTQWLLIHKGSQEDQQRATRIRGAIRIGTLTFERGGKVCQKLSEKEKEFH